MEVLLNYNWNVYKVFKNGRRAKTPFHVFEHDKSETVNEYYDENIKKNFSKKIRNAHMLILRADLPQTREEENDSLLKLTNIQNRSRVVRRRMKDVNIESGVHACAALTLCSESSWKWQWALLELSTSRYIAGFSPLFSSYELSEKWMEEEIDKL
jgi:hypothetical protein